MADNYRKKQLLNPAPKNGCCALLGIEGKYAKSHIIPQALTSHSTKGARFIESGRGSRPIRRFTSWFDHHLVIAEGEKVLGKIDSDGVVELRRHKLVWSGWGGRDQLLSSDYAVPPEPDADFGVRLIEDVNVKKLRLFFLSILWRSLRTNIKEFNFLPRAGVDLARIGRMIVEGDPGSFDYHPIALDQIATLGFSHNQSPTYQTMEIHSSDGVREIGYYRLYMQGLVVHIYPESCPELVESIPANFLGGFEKLWVNARRFESTRQYAEMKNEITDSGALWP